MSNLLKDGLAWQARYFGAHESEEITYRRGAQSVTLNATIGRKLLRVQDETGIRVEYTDLSAVIEAVQLDFGAGRVTPERGDQIEITTPYDVQTFEVMPYGSEPCWHWADPIGQTMFKVYAKAIDLDQFYS